MRPIPHLVCWSIGLAAAETQTSDRERAALVTYASGRRRLVEVGVWHGVTTALIRKAMHPDGVLWAVDPFPVGRFGFSPQRPIAKRSVGRGGNGTVEWIRLPGRDAGALYRERGLPLADMVFIDADHSYEAVTDDWSAWSPLVAPGGVVAFHDSIAIPGSAGADSVRAVSDIVRRSPEFDVVDMVDTLTVLRRRA